LRGRKKKGEFEKLQNRKRDGEGTPIAEAGIPTQLLKKTVEIQKRERWSPEGGGEIPLKWTIKEKGNKAKGSSLDEQGQKIN